MTLTDDQAERQKKIDDCREMLNFLEVNPEVQLPMLEYNKIWLWSHRDDSRRTFHDTVTAFGPDAVISYEGDSCKGTEKVIATKLFGTVKLLAEIDRKLVCEQTETTKTVKEWEPFVVGKMIVDAKTEAD